jgi:hypothetical protein
LIKVETFGKIESGKLSLHNRKRFLQEIAQCKDAEVILVVKKRGRRSNQQNRYLFGIVYANCRQGFLDLGYRMDVDQVHCFFKRLFLPERIVDKDGIVIGQWEGSTAELNKDEFSMYIESIRAFAAEHLSTDIPDADKTLAMDF